MMRKDVKVGMAIGAVFLAVVIVWAVVPHRSKPKQVTLAPASSTPVDPNAATVSPEDKPAEPAVKPLPEVTPAPPVISPKPEEPKAPADSSDKKADWARLLSSTTPELPPFLTSTPPAATPGGAEANHLQIADTHDVRPAAPVAPETSDAAPATQPASSGRTHTIQRGETFVSIAKAVYGDPRQFAAIQKANPAVNPNRMKPGTVIALPDIKGHKESSSVVPRSGARPIKTVALLDGGKEYRVQQGDSLHRIAMKLYNNGARADELYQLNKDTIGADPAKVRIGAVLKLPEAPTVTASR